MSDTPTIITGSRGTGRTTLICKLLNEAAHARDGRALLLVDHAQEADRLRKSWTTDETTWDRVTVYPLGSESQYRGHRYVAIGCDLHASRVPESSWLPIEFITLTTFGPLAVAKTEPLARPPEETP